MADIAVVTAVTNDYDFPGEHQFIDGVDYIYFTDGLSYPVQSDWVIEYIEEDSNDPRRRAKRYKLNPHSVEQLASYHYVIWIDGSMQILNPRFPFEILEYLNHGLVLSPHFERHCIYDEATIRPLKYQNEPIDEQIESYRLEGFPEDFGLYECGVIARDMTVRAVEELDEAWYQQNMDWSYQDQLSLPYCLWKLGFTPDILPRSFRDMDWIRINVHRLED